MKSKKGCNRSEGNGGVILEHYGRDALVGITESIGKTKYWSISIENCI